MASSQFRENDLDITDHAFLDKSHIMTVFDQFQIPISQNQGSVAREVNDYSSNARFPKQVGGQTKQGAEASWKCLTHGHKCCVPL